MGDVVREEGGTVLAEGQALDVVAPRRGGLEDADLEGEDRYANGPPVKAEGEGVLGVDQVVGVAQPAL